MTGEFKAKPVILGQLDATGGVDDDIYTVPARRWSFSVSMVVCNRTAGTMSFRIAIRPLGVAISNEQYLYYDLPIVANDTFEAALGIGLSATDVVTVFANAPGITFTLIGTEDDV